VDPIAEVVEKAEMVKENGQEVEEVVGDVENTKVEPKTPIKKVEDDEDGDDRVVPPSTPDPYYPPIIYLPEVVVNSGEEGEEEMFRRRAKLYRYAHEESPAEWKERGTGEVKIMKHPETGSARIIMRREKTMKVCANHSILSWMDLKPNCGSQKAWVWKTQADFADALTEEDRPKQETLAIRFGTIDNSKAFETAFLLARQYVLENQAARIERGQGDGQENEDQQLDILKRIARAVEGEMEKENKPDTVEEAENEEEEANENKSDNAEEAVKSPEPAKVAEDGDTGLAEKLSDLAV